MLGQTTECGEWKDGAFCIKGVAYFVHWSPYNYSGCLEQLYRLTETGSYQTTQAGARLISASTSRGVCSRTALTACPPRAA